MRKPPYHWRNFENVRKELIPTIETCMKKYGRLPRYAELKESGYGSLLQAIDESFGGLTRFYSRLGYYRRRKPQGYWNNFENLKRELMPILTTFEKENSGLPTESNLRQMGKPYLIDAMSKHGGMIKVYNTLGFKTKTKPYGYWKNYKNLKKELMPIIRDFLNKEKHLPTADDLTELGKSSFVTAINRHHGGLPKFYLRLGYKPIRKPYKYWQNLGNIKKELKMVADLWLENHDHPPTGQELSKKGHSSLVSAIHEYDHNLYELYRELGYKSNKRKPLNYWSKHVNLINELKILIELSLKQNKRLPQWQEISKINSTLAHRITEKGGLLKFYDELNLLNLYPVKRKPPNYWKDLDNVKKELLNLINKLGYFPSTLEIEELKMSSLEAAIQKYHGGLEKMKEIMGYSPAESPRGFKYFLENEKIARLVLEKFGSDTAVVADVMAIIYEDRITSREELLGLLVAPSLKEYLGEFKKPEGGIPDLVETGTHILPFDKGGKIRDILYNDELGKRDNRLGPRPSKEEREIYLIELSNWIKKMESSKEKNQPHIIILKDIVVELFNDTTELYEMYEKGIEGLTRRVRNPEFENG